MSEFPFPKEIPLIMESTNRDIIYRGNSVISVETLPDYAQPVVIKKPAKRHPFQRSLRTLENEYQMTRALDGVEGVRQALGQQTIDNQPALILEYIEGQTLRETIASRSLDLRSRLEFAVDLARILGGIHQQNVIHLALDSENILIGRQPGTVHIIDLGSAALIGAVSKRSGPTRCWEPCPTSHRNRPAGSTALSMSARTYIL